MKPLNWVELTRQQIKARHGFGWSIQGIEKQNKVITKIVYRFSNGQRSTVITDIEWNTNNSKKIQDLIIEFETLMNERHVDLKKAPFQLSRLVIILLFIQEAGMVAVL